jgi:hypothetical protein
MKRMLAALTLALLVSLVMASVATSAPPNDLTTGAGKVSTSDFLGAAVENKFSFSAFDEDAIGGSTSTARNGQYRVEGTVGIVDVSPFPPLFSQTAEVQGKVDCIWVFENRAFFGGPITKSSNPDYEGMNAYFDVADNDQPPLNGEAPDEFLWEFITPEQKCLGPIPGPPITQGNIVVNDAQQMAAGVTAPQEAPQQREETLTP